MSTSKTLLYSTFLAMLAGGLFLYLPVRSNKFVHEDAFFISGNALLDDPRIFEFLFSPDFAKSISGADYFAPIATLSFVLDKYLHTSVLTHNLSAAGVHATNLALYLAICALAYQFLMGLTRRPVLASLAAIFFVAHPIHTQSVNYISSRAELLGTFFTLLAVLLSWKKAKALWSRTVLMASVGLCVLFAALSSPIGFAAPLILLISDLTRRGFARAEAQTEAGSEPNEEPGAEKEPWAQRLRAGYAPMAVALGLVVCLRFVLYGSISTVQEPHPYFDTLSGAETLLAPFQVLLRYVTLCVYPYPLTLIYNPLEQGANPLLVPGAAAAAILAALALVFAALGRWAPGVRSGGLLFLAAIIPSLPFWPAFDVLSESNLLLPSLGLSLAVAGVFMALGDSSKPLLEGTRNTIVAFAAMVLITVMAILCQGRGQDWKTSNDLWNAEYRMHPRDELVLAKVALEHQLEGRMDQAEETYLKAYRYYSARPDIYCELAQLYLDQGKVDEAREVLDDGLQVATPRRVEYYILLGLLFERLEDWDKAELAYRKGRELDPGNWYPPFLMGSVYFIRKEFEAAVEEYELALKSAPPDNRGAVLYNLSKAFRVLGDYDQAMERIEKAIRFDPADPYYRIEKASVYTSMNFDPALEELGLAERDKKVRKNVRQAQEVLDKALAEIPTPNRQLYLTVIDIQQKLGFYDNALGFVKTARRLFSRDLPFDNSLRLKEAYLYTLKKDFPKAGKRFAAMQEDARLRNKPHVTAGLGYCLFEANQDEAAKLFCELTLRADRTNPLGLYLFRQLVERGRVNMDADLIRNLPPNVIIPSDFEVPIIETPEANQTLPPLPAPSPL